MKLESRVALITGAGQGIGRSYALAFANEGADVVIADINDGQALAVAEEIRQQGGNAISVKVDVANEDSVIQMVDTVLNEFGRIDILVNNAAIFSSLKMKPFEEISVQEWDQVLKVNAHGTFLCCQKVAPVMRKQKYGRIINVSSSVVMTGRPDYAHYVASKGAVYSLTHALATELGTDSITVNSISPHGIVTEIDRETVSEDQWEGILAQQALKRRGEVSDIVGVTLFLASDESKYITGQTIGVDAGLRYT